MITWLRPCGSTVTTNETPATIAYAELHKWEREGQKIVKVIEVEMDSDQAIDSITTKEALKSHLNDVHGVKIDLRGSMEHVKSKAKKAVKECLQQRK